jgi:hypothetical protein
MCKLFQKDEPDYREKSGLVLQVLPDHAYTSPDACDQYVSMDQSVISIFEIENHSNENP